MPKNTEPKQHDYKDTTFPNTNIPDNTHRVKKFGRDTLTETIDEMRRVIRLETANPFTIQVARKIIYPCKSHDHACEINRLFYFVRNGLRYVYDPQGTEMLTIPSILIRRIMSTNRAEKELSQGDCDDHSLLLATLLLCIGIDCSFRVINTKDNTDNFHHIYVVAHDGDRDIPLDTIFKDYTPGKELRYKKKKDFPLGVE